MSAAAKIIARKGFAGAAIEDIAEEAGFTRGAFHSNFKDKEDLFLQLVARQVQMLTHSVAGILSETTTTDAALEKLRACYSCYYTSEDKDAFLLFTEAQLLALRNPKFSKKLNQMFGEINDALTATISDLQKRLGGAEVDAPTLVFIGFALSHGMALHNLMDGNRYSDDMMSRGMEYAFDRLFNLKT